MIIYILFISFTQSVMASKELKIEFKATKLDLITFFEGSENLNLQRIGVQIRNKDIEVEVIDPSNFNKESRRHSAFYSDGKVFLSEALNRTPKDAGLRSLLIHEILSAHNMGDSDYELSQILNWHMANNINSEDDYLSNMIQKRIYHSIAFSNEPIGNRSLLLGNGGSIVGGGGDYLETYVLSSFFEKAMNRRLKELGWNYINTNKGTLTNLISNLSNTAIIQKNKCPDSRTVIYVGKKSQYGQLPKLLILYNSREDKESIVEAIDYLDNAYMTKGNFIPSNYLLSCMHYLSTHLNNDSCEI